MRYTEAVSASEGTTHIAANVGAVSVPQGISPALPLADTTAPTTMTSQKAHSQYIAYHGSSNFRAYKQQKRMHGHIYILKENQPQATMHIPPNSDENDDIMPHIFSAFTNLPVLYTETSIQSFLAMNKKEDTLTQSQMLRTTNHARFIEAQIPEIRGLEKMDVFQYKNIQDLPPRAKLLSSIWSYRRKWRPNGDLIKHKARICVDGSQQQYVRDYWETYAPVVSWVNSSTYTTIVNNCKPQESSS
jgi:hypothetical protein